ncbi:recombinase family protein [Hymenobacter bucti]|uniref:Recombinase family protein n=1 Tax=Hymenobacter bucti TaxID=1844114 RepID=A0ABW4QYV9_9BACT
MVKRISDLNYSLLQPRRAAGGVLLIAKLDRLSRNASFILTLRDSGVDFVCCDMPDANTLTVGLFAVVGGPKRVASDALIPCNGGTFTPVFSFAHGLLPTVQVTVPRRR